MKIMVVGSGGQLGTFLVSKLAWLKSDFLALNKKALNITDVDSVRRELKRHQPDIIINAAAYTNVDKAELDPENAFMVNHIAVKHLAKAAHNSGALLIHLSSDYVFDGVAITPYTESDSVLAINVYGKTKIAAEQAIHEEAEKYIIIRTSWLFSDLGENFFTKIKSLLKTSKNLQVVDDQFGGPTYAGDLAEFIVTIIGHYALKLSLPYGIYHYSGHPFVSRYQFACYVRDNLGDEFGCDIHPVDSTLFPMMATRPKSSCLNSLKTQRDFNVIAPDWREAVKFIASGGRCYEGH